ncbi:hypothetical protein G6F43_005514 [Rhizopus delemar]|nr:hypothetical protein G6F43_005514 [Rhizopus delemar]
MLNIVNSIQPTPANTQTLMNPEFSGSFQDSAPPGTTKSTEQHLESHKPLEPFEFPPLQNSATALLQSTPWHQPEKPQQIKDQLTPQRQQPRLQRQEAAARLLQLPCTNQGFKYIYLPTKDRVHIGQIRSRLRKLDINNNRVIDIHYPDRNIVALLIHNDYEDELRQQLQRFKVTIKEYFNPCDPQVLRESKYADRTPAEREDLVFMHHCNRIERALQYTRSPVKFAVARYFYSKGSQDTDIFFSDDDHMSTFEETKDINQATARLAKQAISPILHLAQSSSVLLITEAWHLPSNKYPTHWKKFHTYGIKLQPLATKGHQGISLLINPTCPHHVHHLPNDDMSISQYKLSFIIADTLIHCVYLPHSLDNQVVSQVLDSLPRTAPDVKHTILCGEFNMVTRTQFHLMEPTPCIWKTHFYSTPRKISLDSAHKMMSFSYHTNILPEAHTQQPRTTWKLTKLQDAKTRNQYIQNFQNAANNISMLIENNKQQPQDQQSARDFIEKLNDDICQAVYISLDNICGRIGQQTDPLKDFWTAEMRQAYETKEYYYRKWRKAYGLNKLHFWLQHQQARATLRHLIHQRR